MGYLRNALCLVHPSPEVFGRSQWCCSQVIYIYFRYLFAFYVVGWDVLLTIRGSYQHGGWYQVDLKVFSFHLLALYSFISVVSALVHWVRVARWRYESFSHKQMRSTGYDVVINTSRSTLRSVGTAPSIYRSNPWCYRLDWLLFNFNVTFNPIVTILYWLPIIVNRENFLQEDILNNLAIVHLTIVNTALIYLDLLIRRIPVRLVHSIYPMALWVIYMAVNAVVHVTMQTGPDRPEQFLYTFYFNWDAENVAPSIGYALAVFFGILGLHLLAFVIFELRKGLFQRCCKDVGYLDETDYSSEASFQMTSGLCCSVCGRGRASHDVVFH